MKDLFPKMDKMGVPRVLKTIFIQTKWPEDLLEENYIDKLLEQLNFSRSFLPEITFKLFYIGEINSRNANLLCNESYLKDVEKLIGLLTPQGQNHSVASLMNYIENFNLAINGKCGFDHSQIVADIKINFSNCYENWKKSKENQLLSKEFLNSFTTLNDVNESFENFI